MNIWTNIAQLLYPAHCCLCGEPDTWLCGNCHHALPRNLHACHRCALPLPPTPAPTAHAMPLCGRCLKRPPPYTTIVAPFLYQPPIDHLIGQLKFAGQLHMAPLFANLMHDAIKQLPDTDALVPVPLHRWRLLRRGFNQSALMARAISRSSGLPIFDAATRRVGGPALHGMHATQRRRAIRDVFTLSQSVAGMRLTLVDDVVTTGATVGELSRLLLRAGAQRVSVLCLARTPNH